MAFRRMNDRLSKINSKSFSIFRGSHCGFGKCDQPAPYAYQVDFDVRNEKLELRDGQRKNSSTGYTAGVSAVFGMGLGRENQAGIVVNGVLSVHPVSDLLAGIRKYYRWDEVAGDFTWDELMDGKTWNDLVTRSE